MVEYASSPLMSCRKIATKAAKTIVARPTVVTTTSNSPGPPITG